ncbi:MAG: HNH endonuclease [Clostridium sp.]|uniref:HNH endonuclease n=1 Tax=Clostridium sp. TaxID=1506 RepID=UPI003D6D9BF4
MNSITLKKLCRCGKVIDYTHKYCSECEPKVKKDKADRNRYYDKNIRQHANVYANKIWHQLRELCKNKFNGLDIYSYYVLGAIVYEIISHYVELVEDNIGRAYDISNLLYVDTNTHSMIHSAYNRSDKDKKDMKDMLFELIKRWEEDYC